MRVEEDLLISKQPLCNSLLKTQVKLLITLNLLFLISMTFNCIKVS